MIRVNTMTEAFTQADRLTHDWLILDTGAVINELEFSEVAKAFDNEENLPPETFFLVSSEGAIGMASHYEYLVEWLFIPAEPEVIQRAEREAVEELAANLQAEEAAKPAAKFCFKCGSPIIPGTKFCNKCGAPVTM